MKDLADLLKGLSSLLWPCFAFYVAIRYSGDISRLVKRLKKGKLFGQEIELNDDLVRLESSVRNVELHVEAKSDNRTSLHVAVVSAPDEAISRTIALEASKSPVAAVVMLGAELELTSRRLMANVGILQGRRHVPLETAFTEIDAQFSGLVNSETRAALELFRTVRNRLVHKNSGTEEDFMRAIDSGLTLLRTLQSIPLETRIVVHTGFPVYSDPDCTIVMEGVTGVMIETTRLDGSNFSSVYPTTRTDYVVGRPVAWEWDPINWPAGWYRDFVTSEPLGAWGQAATFVGRHLDDI